MCSWRAVLPIAAVLALASPAASAADHVTSRTLDELKTELLARASENPPRSMAAGMKLEDIREALGNIKSMDRDEWARAFIPIGERYVEQARKQEAAGKLDGARGDYRRAYRYFKLAHYPVDNSPDKKRAYQKGVEAYLAYGRLLDPPLEVVRIPFEGKEIVGYLRLPKSAAPVPLVFSVTALDSRKEDWSDRFGAYLKDGVGFFVTDMPGTGQAPIIADETADRMMSRALDYLVTRKEIDPRRIGFYGGSWSGYWAVKLSVTERARLRAVAAQGLGAHDYFQPEWQRVALKTPAYLMDLLPARASVYGLDSEDKFLAYGPRMSLKAQGILDKPSAPLLLVNGWKDPQVPISDLFLVARTLPGAPKDVWVNPDGGHMGRGGAWSSQRISAEVVQPWMVRQLKAPDVAPASADAEDD